MPKDSNSLRIVKLNTYITRSKWMLGVYAGILAITGNDVFKPKLLPVKIIICLCLIGAIILAYAIVKFEQHLIEIRESLYNGAKGKNDVSVDEKIYNSALNFFTFNFIWTIISGAALIFFLWFSCLDNTPTTKDETRTNNSGLGASGGRLNTTSTTGKSVSDSSSVTNKAKQ